MSTLMRPTEAAPPTTGEVTMHVFVTGATGFHWDGAGQGVDRGGAPGAWVYPQ